MSVVAMLRGAPRYSELLELATVLVREIQHPEQCGASTTRCTAGGASAVTEVACLVMDWQIALGEDKSMFAFETATLFEVAVELVVNRGLRAGDALYAELAAMPAGRLTTWESDFDAWFSAYGRARSRIELAAHVSFPGSEGTVANYSDVIVTPFCLRVGMIEQTFFSAATTQLTMCGRAPTDAAGTFGLAAYRAVGRHVAVAALAAGDGLDLDEVSDDDRRDLVELFEEFAVALGDIDLPPLPCIMLDERYRPWLFDVLLVERGRLDLALLVEAVCDVAVGSLCQVRGSGACCAPGGGT